MQLCNSWILWPHSEITTAHCCATQLCIVLHGTPFFHFAGCFYCILFAPHTSSLFLNLLFTEVCVRRPDLCVYSRACMGMRFTSCECVMAYWSSPAEVAGPQVRSIKTMGNLSWGALHFTGAIWLAITKEQIAMMTNKILTEAMPSSMMGWNRCYFIVIESYWQH